MSEVLIAPIPVKPDQCDPIGVSFAREYCLNLEKSLRDEWLETNGLGGYASSTILGCHTRKYHGLLVAPVSPIPDKMVLLSKVEPTLTIGNSEFHLSTNKFPGVFHPTGHKYIESFEQQLFPHTRWRIGDVRLSQSLMMIRGRNAVILKLVLENSPKPVRLWLRPLLAFRSFHALVRENMDIRVKVFRKDSRRYRIEPYAGLPSMDFTMQTPLRFFPGPQWHYNVEYLEERERGFGYQEDLFCPGVFMKRITEGVECYLAASIGPLDATPAALWKQELANRESPLRDFGSRPRSLATLQFQSRHFLIQSPGGFPSVTAGYPWFGEWGRDTLISLPGLCFHSGRVELGYAVLQAYASQEKGGRIPNILSPPPHGHAYNAVDTSLWLFWCAREYWNASHHLENFRTTLLPAMGRILEAFRANRVTGVRITPEGLLEAGAPNTQWTWMDAHVDGVPVTPRHGLAVELNALWIHALGFFLERARDLGIAPADELEQILASAREAFPRVFWLEEGGYLADVVQDGVPDRAMRPNQIFAVSLSPSPLDPRQQKAVVEGVRRELATPFGIRSLAPKNPAYRATYEGGPASRDGAYHQGTVWPWLVGAYCEASLATAEDTGGKAGELIEFFRPLWDEHLKSSGVLQLSEIFDGNPPHLPRGCPAQAWSVAEAIRAQVLLRKART